jgi:hypothetical protein
MVVPKVFGRFKTQRHGGGGQRERRGLVGGRGAHPTLGAEEGAKGVTVNLSKKRRKLVEDATVKILQPDGKPDGQGVLIPGDTF